MEKIDFSKYKIYLDDSGCMGDLLAPDEDPPFFEKKFIYPFDEGIKKLQEENRGLYWLNERSNPEMSKYFKDVYNIYMS